MSHSWKAYLILEIKKTRQMSKYMYSTLGSANYCFQHMTMSTTLFNCVNQNTTSKVLPVLFLDVDQISKI